jgi:hypothetical protein
MGSFARPRVFDPLDLQIIDLVYEAAWAQLEARDPYRDLTDDPKRQEVLRKKVFAVARPGAIEFDDLLDKVLAISPEISIRNIEHGNQQAVDDSEVTMP